MAKKLKDNIKFTGISALFLVVLVISVIALVAKWAIGFLGNILQFVVVVSAIGFVGTLIFGYIKGFFSNKKKK